MNTFIAYRLSSTLDTWLCAALIAFTLAVPFAVIAVDGLMSKQPEWMHSAGFVAQTRWPRLTTAIGTALLLAAFLTLMVMCAQLATV
jgi:hypothetical protein